MRNAKHQKLVAFPVVSTIHGCHRTAMTCCTEASVRLVALHATYRTIFADFLSNHASPEGNSALSLMGGTPRAAEQLH